MSYRKLPSGGNAWKSRPSESSFLLVLSLPTAIAQDKAKAHIEVTAIAARPEDVSSPEAIVKADYECVSGGIGVARQWARDFSLYDQYARSFVPSKDEKTGALVIWHPMQQEYADEADEQLVRDGFNEHELAYKIYQYGNVATVLRSYEVSPASTGKLYRVWFLQNNYDAGALPASFF